MVRFVSCVVLSVPALTIISVAAMEQQQQKQRKPKLDHRGLQAAFDFFDIDVDLCDNSDPSSDGPEELGRCDTTRFPVCDSSRQEICYNRKPSRDHFYPDTHQPKYFIQYDRVFCYPNTWGGCSSCTPGRYCSSEERCILDEIDYPCAQWF